MTNDIPKLSENQVSEIIEMALSDDISFDNIKQQYGINSDTVKSIMKQNISFASYRRWRQRVKVFSKRREHYK